MLIINSVLGDATGGRWRVVCDYARMLLDQGHEVLMPVADSLPADPPGIPEGVELLRVRNHGHYDYLAAWRLARRLRPRRPAVAIAHCSRSVALLARALGPGTPVLAVTHSCKVRRLLRADAVIVLTETLRDRVRSAPGGGEKPVYRVPNSVPLPGQGCPALAARRRPPVIGALGRFDPVKGFDLLVEALGRLRRQGRAFRALIAGEGEREADLRARIEALGLAGSVELCGWIEPAAVTDFLGELDLLCVPARSDAFGLTPLQGAAAGIPLLLSRAEGHRAMFADNREALFFDVDDAPGLAAGIERMLGDESLRQRLARAAFARVEREYSEMAVARALKQAIDKSLL